jgi:hypothetical protein
MCPMILYDRKSRKDFGQNQLNFGKESSHIICYYYANQIYKMGIIIPEFIYICLAYVFMCLEGP